MKTRFKSFLTEGTKEDHPDRVKPLELPQEEIMALLKKNCSHALVGVNAGHFIYRGERSFSSDCDVFETNFSLGRRKAQNTHDFYRIFLDSVLDQHNFPLRSRSMICSTDQYYASTYGVDGFATNVENTFVVFPFNNQKIGICTRHDIFDLQLTIPEIGSYNVDELSSAINHGFKEMRLKNNDPSFAHAFTLDELEEYVNKYQDLYDEFISGFLWSDNSSVINNAKERVPSFSALFGEIKKAMAPQKMKYLTQSTSEFFNNDHEKQEVWFSGKAYMIRLDYFLRNF